MTPSAHWYGHSSIYPLLQLITLFEELMVIVILLSSCGGKVWTLSNIHSHASNTSAVTWLLLHGIYMSVIVVLCGNVILCRPLQRILPDMYPPRANSLVAQIGKLVSLQHYDKYRADSHNQKLEDQSASSSLSICKFLFANLQVLVCQKKLQNYSQMSYYFAWRRK